MAQVLNIRKSAMVETKVQKNAVALCRVSTEDQFTKGLSVPEQRQRIQKWADKNNVKIIKWTELFHSVYRGLDEDTQVLELLEYAKSNKNVSLLLVDEKSRFARRKYLRVVWQEDLRRHGVQVVGVSEPEYDARTVHGVWMESISEAKDEARSAETAYHTTKGMMRNAATRDDETGYCYKNGGIAPDGYDNKRVIRGKDSKGKDNVKLVWELNEERAKIIRYITLDLWWKQKASYRIIRDHLNSDGPKYNDIIEPILNSKGKPWSSTTIREICLRALEGVYSGLYYWNRTGRDLRGTGQKWKDTHDWVVIENAHPAIISMDEWNEMKEEMEPIVMKNKESCTKRVARSEDSQYLFSGLNSIGEAMFVCQNCRGNIVGHQIARKYFYICSTYKNRGSAGCDKGVSLKKDEVEQKVLAAIKKRFSPDKIKIMVKEVSYILDESIKDQKKAEKHVINAIQEKEKAIGNIMNAIEKGDDISAVGIFVNKIEVLQKEKLALEQELLSLQNDKPKIQRVSEKEINSNLQNLEELINDNEASNRDKKQAIRYFVRQIQYDPVEGELHIFYWPNPCDNSEKIKLLKELSKNKKEDDSLSSPSKELLFNSIIPNGAGDRNRTGTVVEDRRILSPVRLPIPPPRRNITVN